MTYDTRHELFAGRWSLGTLNSLTKYPSIPTYHPLGEKGRLRDEPPLTLAGPVTLTEKVDGTNARVIVMPDGTTIVGSREELLWARGDLIRSPLLAICRTLDELGLVDRAARLMPHGGLVQVLYGEVYGRGIGSAGKRYAAGTNRTGFTLFDVAEVPTEYLTWEREAAATWRDAGGQDFRVDIEVDRAAHALQVIASPTLGVVTDAELPVTLAETAEWLRGVVPYSRVALDDERSPVAAEGVVLRGCDDAGRRLLAKARFEDYERTARAAVRA